MIQAGEVIWLFAGTLLQPKPKMHACVCVERGWFMRINSKSHWPSSVLLPRADHLFLHHDSYLECGNILEVDDYEIEQALADPNFRRRALSPAVIAHLKGFIPQVPSLTVMQKAAIVAALP